MRHARSVNRAGNAPPRFWLYASFARGRSGGNPAGVVLSDETVGRRAAQSLAAVLGLPTTGFVELDERAPARSASARFFTPQGEIDACGHVTIAIATALADAGIWGWSDDVVVHARGGDFPLRLRDGRVEMSQRPRELGPAAVEWADVEEALGPIRARADLPLASVATGLRHLIVPLEDVAALSEITLDAARIAALAVRCDVDTICAWAANGRARVRMRDLCARIGDVEEPASGTTAAALALYLARTGQIGDRFVVDQGVEMGRPSRIDVVLDGPDAITVHGHAQRVLAGTVEIELGRVPGRKA
jgi:trans-2,3-dihydro-3-hydroxyanthranilate isomerase